jgi:hypothetical protein
MKNFFPLFFLLLLASFSSCKLPNDTTIEASTPPQIERISITPEIILVDKISDNFDPETIVDTTIIVTVQTHDLNNDISAVTISIISADSVVLSTNIPLSDDGVLPDSLSADGIYSGAVHISFKKKNIGIYPVYVSVVDKGNNDVKATTPLRIENTNNTPPVVSSLGVADTSFIQTGNDTVLVKISVSVQDQQGLRTIVLVNGHFFSLDGEYSHDIQFYDDGGQSVLPLYSLTSGDAVAGDGIFTITVPFTKKQVTDYSIQVHAVDSANAQSSTATKQFSIRNLVNHTPAISAPTMPDTVIVPKGTDTNFVVVSIAVFDEEGLDDIRNVTFTSKRDDNTTVGTYEMFDDGGNNGVTTFGIPSGDAVANDGMYTITVPLTKGTTTPTYRDFIFQAEDRGGAVSETVTKRIYLK